MIEALHGTDWEGWLIRFAAASVAGGVVWRMWLRPAQRRLLRALDEHHAVVELIRTEFNTTGGHTIKDAVNALADGQRSMMACQEAMLTWMQWHDKTYASGHPAMPPIGGGVNEPPPPLPVPHEVKR